MTGKELIQFIIDNNMLETEIRTASSGDDLNTEDGYEITGTTETENEIGDTIGILLVD